MSDGQWPIGDNVVPKFGCKIVRSDQEPGFYKKTKIISITPLGISY